MTKEEKDSIVEMLAEAETIQSATNSLMPKLISVSNDDMAATRRKLEVRIELIQVMLEDLHPSEKMLVCSAINQHNNEGLIKILQSWLDKV